MIRGTDTIDGHVRLGLSGREDEVRRAVDAFFQTYEPWAWNSRMERASYRKEGRHWFLTVLLIRSVSVNPKYRRDYGNR